MAEASAIIATFNQEKYIAESVLSLIDQVQEVIVVDDFSSDGTWEILQSLHDPRLRAVRNEVQQGVSASYNRAANLAQSEILIIQGGDDRSLSGRVAEQIGVLSNHDVSLVHSLPIVIDSLGRRLPDDAASEFRAPGADSDPLSFLYFNSNFICAPSVAVRTASYLRHGGFRRGIDLLQDFELWLSLAAEGAFSRLDAPAVEYRKHGQNTSREYVRLDAPKQRRLLAEREFVLSNFLDSADAETIARLGRSCSLNPESFLALDRQQQTTLIELSHPDRLIIRRGLARLFAIYGSPDGYARIQRMGLGSQDLSTFASLADHGNSGDLAQALSASRPT